MIRKGSILVWLILVVCFSSCQRSGVYEEYVPVGPAGWNKDSLAKFSFEIDDTSNVYNLLINVRNQNSYPYSNLWLFIDIVAPDQSVLRDTFELQMARPDGKWLGQGFGSLFDMQSPYRQKVFFPIPGTYSISFQQGMRDVVLPGIHDVGIRVEKY